MLAWDRLKDPSRQEEGHSNCCYFVDSGNHLLVRRTLAALIYCDWKLCQIHLDRSLVLLQALSWNYFRMSGTI